MADQKKEQKIENVIIIGSGPAGLTAAIYTGRADLHPLVFMGKQPGGQLTGTTMVENWPGEIAIDGNELMDKLKKHADYYGARLQYNTVTSVDLSEKPYSVTINSGETFKTNSIIVSSGSTARTLKCPGEKEYWGRGVSTCATCDAPFYRDKEVVIVGGGNSAVTYADVLARFARKVTIVHILDKLTATDPIKDAVLANQKIEIIYSHTVTEILGDGARVTGVTIQEQSGQEQSDQKTKAISADGVFIAIGFTPNTELFAGQVERNNWGYFVSGDKITQTSVPGVFAAGDVVDGIYHQAITAAGQGCMAALDCEYYLTGEVKTVYSK